MDICKKGNFYTMTDAHRDSIKRGKEKAKKLKESKKKRLKIVLKDWLEDFDGFLFLNSTIILYNSTTVFARLCHLYQ